MLYTFIVSSIRTVEAPSMRSVIASLLWRVDVPSKPGGGLAGLMRPTRPADPRRANHRPRRDRRSRDPGAAGRPAPTTRPVGVVDQPDAVTRSGDRVSRIERPDGDDIPVDREVGKNVVRPRPRRVEPADA
jgi:hypothetical protein